jgi:hypothetical protein
MGCRFGGSIARSTLGSGYKKGVVGVGFILIAMGFWHWAVTVVVELDHHLIIPCEFHGSSPSRWTGIPKL